MKVNTELMKGFLISPKKKKKKNVNAIVGFELIVLFFFWLIN